MKIRKRNDEGVMKKSLSEMTLNELWGLFPIILTGAQYTDQPCGKHCGSRYLGKTHY